MSVIVERVPHSGALILSTIRGGYLVSRIYYGYTIRQAKLEFKNDLGSNK